MNNLKGIVIQPGSYNPIHRGHLSIFKASKEHYPTYEHSFILASKTCDKGIILLEELEARSEAIKGQGGHYRIVDSGLFVDIIKIFKEEGYDKIILAVGEDTLYRFFRDWHDYYEKDPNSEGSRCYEDYAEKFENVEWYVSRRNCPELDDYKALSSLYLHGHNNVVWSDLDLDDISSTKIREGIVPNE